MPTIEYGRGLYSITLPTNIVDLGAGITFDITKAHEIVNNIRRGGKDNQRGLSLTEEAELGRLFLHALPKPEVQADDGAGGTFTIPAQKGIDLRTATAQELIDYLNDPTAIMGESRRELIRRLLDIKYPTEFNAEIDKVSPELKTEYELIRDSTRTKDIIWLGEVGFQNKVRLDGSLDKN